MSRRRREAYELDRQPALCIDLDGTLLKSDSLWESLLSMLSRAPWLAFLLPVWVMSGKARLKREVALRGMVDPATLPYDARILAMVRASNDRHRVLCTAADATIADAISNHLGCFEEVLASDGRTNLKGNNKATALLNRFGENGFDYAGNDVSDLHVWPHAAGAIVVGPGSLADAAARMTPLRAHMKPDERSGWSAWIRAFRWHQWLKNLLVLVPLFTSHRFLEWESVLSASVAFIAFCLCASGVYVLNDLLDLSSDRTHPRKRSRSFASGELPLSQGLVVGVLLPLASFAVALLCGTGFAIVLLCYYVMTLAYSLRLKRIVMVDVIILASLYTTRIVAGTFAIGLDLSFWLLAFSMFMFLSLAMLKRHTELSSALAEGKLDAKGRGYDIGDLPLVQSMGAAAGYMGVLVFALYINSQESLVLYERPKLLWLLCPMLLYWISRMWMISHRGKMHDDPVVFTLTDHVSQIVMAFCVAVVLAAI